MNICSQASMPIFKVIGNVLTLIKIAVPILLIVMGSIDLMKAVMAGKDDEIKKSQGTFVKRIIAAVIVFFIPTIVGLLLTVINQDKSACLKCVLDTSVCNTVMNGSGSNPSGSGNQGEFDIPTNIDDGDCTVDDEDCIDKSIYIEG